MVLLAGAFIAAVVVYQAISIIVYNKTSYKKITHNSYFTTMYDKGRRGEYEIYRNLKGYEALGYRFLFNVYLPKANGKTTEIDIVMIGHGGVFVFESKNYSGWIFGNDSQKSWTQVLPKGKGNSGKEHFYNPIWQNRTHCEALRPYLPQGIGTYPVVLFSDRCTFKDVTVNDPGVAVAHRREAVSAVNGFLLDGSSNSFDIDSIYEKLYPFTQVSEETKRSHIDEIGKYR